ncbi:unnamed protein product [Calicophoron daubneyi]|uniref:Zinc finger CCHC domain-containing protein 7 n=1 Tax=Calicophoron daubneyi TaxID=300641 RepID=A0AAV2TRV1_CALDB
MEVDDDYEEFQGYDSDAVDEDVENTLYSAVFYDNEGGLQSLENSKDNDCAIIENAPLVKTVASSDEPGRPIYSQPNERASSVGGSADISATSVGSTLCCSLPKREISLNISSFKDDTGSDSDDFDINPLPVVDVGCPTDSESIETIGSGDSDLSSTQLKPHDVSNWSADDVVLGVSNRCSSHVCNSDDSIAIARRLSSSSSDPNLWQIMNADRSSLFGGRKNRYFGDAQNTLCLKCGARGHLSLECRNTGPVCIFCGGEGHSKDECKKVYCYACLAPGHLKNSCPFLNQLRSSICGRCGLLGHDSKLCTELWRQYRNTTQPGKPIPTPKKMEINPKGCCNCGKLGHSVDECRRKPFRSGLIGPLPHRRVLVYDKKDIYSKIKNKQKLMRKRRQKSENATQGEMRKGKKLNGKKKSKARKPDSKSAEISSLEDLESEVSQKLYKQVVERQLHHPHSSFILGNDASMPKSPSAESTPFRSLSNNRKANRRISQDGASFLPLNPSARKWRDVEHTGPTRQHGWKRRDIRRSHSTPSFSPFFHIGGQFSHTRLNDSAASSPNSVLLNIADTNNDGNQIRGSDPCNSFSHQHGNPRPIRTSYTTDLSEPAACNPDNKRKKQKKNRKRVLSEDQRQVQLKHKRKMRVSEDHPDRTESKADSMLVSECSDAPALAKQRKLKKKKKLKLSNKVNKDQNWKTEDSWPVNSTSSKVRWESFTGRSPEVELWD